MWRQAEQEPKDTLSWAKEIPGKMYMHSGHMWYTVSCFALLLRLLPFLMGVSEGNLSDILGLTISTRITMQFERDHTACSGRQSSKSI